MIFQLMLNYLVLFGIILITRMVLQRGVMRELVSQVWIISQVSLPNLSIFCISCTFNMIFTCNLNLKGEYNLEYSDIGFYQEESTPLDLVITDNAVSDGMDFNNLKSGIITADHDLGELKLNAHQNDVTLSHHEN